MASCSCWGGGGSQTANLAEGVFEEADDDGRPVSPSVKDGEFGNLIWALTRF